MQVLYDGFSAKKQCACPPAILREIALPIFFEKEYQWNVESILPEIPPRSQNIRH